ncbi:MAG TPA: flagellar biosynthetic protein FliO [Bryobacteraceae bacterium]|jgi:flagellar biosynthetic protein FliO|nr:flagellar biosynthetic protein FliO [Bryobacteraceae bacterium]
MQLTEQIGMVLLVFALMGGLLWFAKRRGMASFPMGVRRGANGRRLEVLERVPLTPQHALHLVRVAERTVLIATAPSSCTLLDAPVVLDVSATLGRDLLRSNQ